MGKANGMRSALNLHKFTTFLRFGHEFQINSQWEIQLDFFPVNHVCIHWKRNKASAKIT